MRNSKLPLICQPELRSNHKCCMIESPPKSLLEFAFKIYLLFMCVLLKWLAEDPLSTVQCTGQAHSNWTTILGIDSQIMDREKQKNNERDKKVVWGPRKGSSIMRTLLYIKKNPKKTPPYFKCYVTFSIFFCDRLSRIPMQEDGKSNNYTQNNS